jgi:hypothetical protein
MDRGFDYKQRGDFTPTTWVSDCGNVMRSPAMDWRRRDIFSGNDLSTETVQKFKNDEASFMDKALPTRTDQ